MTTQLNPDDTNINDSSNNEASQPNRLYPSSLPPTVARPRGLEDEEADKENGTRKASRETYAAQLIELKHHEYTRWAMVYKIIYYATRVLSAVATGTIPFTLQRAPSIALLCSILACVANVIDTVYDPATRHRRYARATHLLAIIKMKRERTYPANKEALDVLIATEEGDLAQFTDLSAMLKKIEDKNK
jgi:hypothetical protein